MATLVLHHWHGRDFAFVRGPLAEQDAEEVEGDQRAHHHQHADRFGRGQHHRGERDDEDRDAPLVDEELDRNEVHPLQKHHDQRQLKPDTEHQRED